MTTSDGYGYCWERKRGLWPGLLTHWRSWLKALAANWEGHPANLYASFILSGSKVYREWAPSQWTYSSISMRNLLLLFAAAWQLFTLYRLTCTSSGDSLYIGLRDRVRMISFSTASSSLFCSNCIRSWVISGPNINMKIWFFTESRLGDRSFGVAGPRLWNSLPAELRQQDICLTEFRRLLKTFLFADTRCIVTSLF